MPTPVYQLFLTYLALSFCDTTAVTKHQLQYDSVIDTADTTTILTYFTTLSLGNTVKILWASSKNIKDSHFEIEHSTNNTIYTPIAKIKCIGSTSKIIDYETTDNAPSVGTNYYRLVRYSTKGEKKIFKAKKLKFELSTEQVSIYPNPVQQTVHIKTTDWLNEDLNLEIFQLDGQVVAKKRLKNENGNFKFDLESKPKPGIYILKIKNTSQAYQTKIEVK